MTVAIAARNRPPLRGPTRARAAGRRSKPMDSDARWEEIIEAASAIFLKNGYEATSLQDIASAVGILKGSIYYYIKAKEDLLFEIVDRAQVQFLATLEEDATTEGASAPCPPLSLHRPLDDTRTRSSGNGTPWPNGPSTVSTIGERLQLVIERRDHFSDFVKRIIVQGVTEGAFDPKVDVSLATITVFELLNRVHQRVAPALRAAFKARACPTGVPASSSAAWAVPHWDPAQGPLRPQAGSPSSGSATRRTALPATCRSIRAAT